MSFGKQKKSKMGSTLLLNAFNIHVVALRAFLRPEHVQGARRLSVSINSSIRADRPLLAIWYLPAK